MVQSRSNFPVEMLKPILLAWDFNGFHHTFFTYACSVAARFLKPILLSWAMTKQFFTNACNAAVRFLQADLTRFLQADLTQDEIIGVAFVFLDTRSTSPSGHDQGCSVFSSFIFTYIHQRSRLLLFAAQVERRLLMMRTSTF